MRAADVIISNAVNLTYEEELREIPDILEERNISYARNMATTASLLSSNWGLTPTNLFRRFGFKPTRWRSLARSG